MIGAGISHPQVPLASGIISHCKEKVGSDETPRENRSGLEDYSFWLDKAYPHSIQRQRYLRELIERKPLSHANLRLAHLMLETKVTNLVITTNFDDFVSRALTLFGKAHIVCDHPATTGRINPEQNDIQIVHVHGSYWFYDCCNLSGEVENRSQTSNKTTSTMAGLLDRVLFDRSPLVIGYGGWEGDVLMTALKKRLQDSIPYNLYWFCHKKSDVDLLPEWLTSNNQVFFVTPADTKSSGTGEGGRVGSSGYKKASREPQIQSKSGRLSGEDEGEPVLSAMDIFDALINKFKPETPELTRDPLGFYAKHLENAFLHDDAGMDGTDDLYRLSNVIKKVKKAKEREEIASNDIQLPDWSETLLEEIREAMRSTQYEKAVSLAAKIDNDSLGEQYLRELIDMMWSAARRLNDLSNEGLTGYDLVISICEKLFEQNVKDFSLRNRMANAISKKGNRLGKMNRNEEAIAVYDELLERFGDATEFLINTDFHSDK